MNFIDEKKFLDKLFLIEQKQELLDKKKRIPFKNTRKLTNKNFNKLEILT